MLRSLEHWRGRRVLVTGHTGFKGAWLTFWLQRLGAVVWGLALPPDDERSAFCLLGPWPDLEERIIDLVDRAAVRSAVAAAAPDVVFHLGAQSLVRRGYADPSGTYATNVSGCAHLLEAAVGAGASAVVVVTSDKVYLNEEYGRPFVEEDRLGGRDPYSASKACAELVAGSWRSMAAKTAIATARAGNVIGGGDVAPDRLLPDMERALLTESALVLRNPTAIRPWQFVLEPLYGYLLLADLMVERPAAAPAALNFGPPAASCLPVADIVSRATALAGGLPWQPDSAQADAEAGVLRLDASAAAAVLGWRSCLDVQAALSWTVEWWTCHRTGGDLHALAHDQIERYEGAVAAHD